MRRIILCICSFVLMVGCATDISFDLPKGEKGDRGDSGLSAYEVWVDEVNNGTWPLWNSDETAITDFFRFLKGDKGKDGVDGVDGVDGKSAYETWVEFILEGEVENPHGYGYWDKSRTSIKDFYAFITGKQGIQGIQGDKGEMGPAGLNGTPGERGKAGQSAYELWNSLLTIPGAILDKDGNQWDESRNTLQDFFEYLKGADGKDGKDGQNGINGLPGMDGNPGENGASAYELWVKDVESGNVEWDGGTTYQDFWVFLKGEPGEKGDTGDAGADGKDGISAYDMWVAMVLNGLDNPHNTGTNWPSDQISVLHFYQYLRGNQGIQGIQGIQGEPGRDGAPGIAGIAGENGQSAFELWKEMLMEEVISWDEWDGVTELTALDFFMYLKGKDGKDGINGLDGLDGVDGQDGSDGFSAYEIWLQAIVNDNSYDGGTTMEDFIEYLKGQDGQNGIDGVDGINGQNGLDGQNGSDGQSAYSLWQHEVLAGRMEKDGEPWPTDEYSILDFYRYLTGAQGLSGENGEDGKDADFLVRFDGVVNGYFAWRNEQTGQAHENFGDFLEWLVDNPDYLENYI